MPAPLKNNQKWEIVKLARAAFAKLDPADIDGQSFDEWRHSEVARACGKQGLRCCDQDDYAGLKAHFLDMLGASGAAFNWHVRAQSQGDRVARAVLERECGKAGVSLGYAIAICKRQFHCELNDASEKQLWSLVYTVRNRATARRRATKSKGKNQEQEQGKEQVTWLN